MTDQRAPAPGELEVVRQFVNSVDLDHGVDSLGDPVALAQWFTARALLLPGEHCSRADLTRAIAVREALRELMLRNNDDGLDSGDPYAVLDAVARRARLTLRFEGAAATLVPTAGGVDAALGTLLGCVHASMTQGTWGRLKACRADSCRWAFYDHSRNGSGTWCQMSVCGSREKMRAYRRRRSDRT